LQFSCKSAMYYKLMPFWTTTKKSLSCYIIIPSSILLSPLSRQLSGFFPPLIIQSTNYAHKTKQKKLHFAWKKHFGKKEVAGFSSWFFFPKKKFQFFHCNSKWNFKWNIKWNSNGIKTSDGYFIFVNRIATELVK